VLLYLVLLYLVLLFLGDGWLGLTQTPVRVLVLVKIESLDAPGAPPWGSRGSSGPTGSERCRIPQRSRHCRAVSANTAP